MAMARLPDSSVLNRLCGSVDIQGRPMVSIDGAIMGKVDSIRVGDSPHCRLGYCRKVAKNPFDLHYSDTSITDPNPDLLAPKKA